MNKIIKSISIMTIIALGCPIGYVGEIYAVDHCADKTIATTDDASNVCPTTCEDYGGWSGSWDSPFWPWDCYVCGCND